MRIALLFFLFIITTFSTAKDSSIPKEKILVRDSFTMKKDLVIDTQKLLAYKSIDFPNVYILSEKKEDFFKTILPILTLILGIFLKIITDYIIDFIKDGKRISKSGKLWKAELICLENPIDTQLESLHLHKNQIEEADEEIPILTYSSALNCENFNALSKVDLLDYFKKKEKRDYVESTKLLNRITVFVTNTKDINDILKVKFKSYLDDTSSAYSELSVNLGRQQKAFMKMVTEFEVKKDMTQLESNSFDAIDQLFMTYIIPHLKDGKYSIRTLSEEFYEQLIPILGHNRLNPMFSELTDIAFDAMTSIKKIEMQKTYWLANIDTISKLYLEQKEFLNKLTEELNKVNCA